MQKTYIILLNGFKFIVPFGYSKDLIQLVLDTHSLDNDEKQYWFDTFTLMSSDQLKRFEEILSHERNELKRIDEEYKNSLEELNKQHLSELNNYAGNKNK